MLFQLVHGVAKSIAEAREAAGATGTTDDEWWYARSALLEEVAVDFTERFPMVAKLAAGGGFTMADETTPYQEQASLEMFRAGLTMLLDGIAAAKN